WYAVKMKQTMCWDEATWDGTSFWSMDDMSTYPNGIREVRGPIVYEELPLVTKMDDQCPKS
ncbi:hypothetical protein QCD71_24970, partial [Sphingomonas sp. PsM26]|nr:hypothetical protein [Sphingomonas sp. PsM26]